MWAFKHAYDYYVFDRHAMDIPADARFQPKRSDKIKNKKRRKRNGKRKIRTHL